ncbi:MAG: arginine repressor [Bacteroidales bacterium]
MKLRTKRLLEIRKLISTSRVANQEELQDELRKMGYDYTQATLSRDLKFLKVGKMRDEEKGSVYVLPEESNSLNGKIIREKLPANGFLSIDFSGSFAVIKTLPGFASSIAYTIDNLKVYEFLGTIAGDDTILLIVREEVSRSDIMSKLAMVIPEIEEKIG